MVHHMRINVFVHYIFCGPLFLSYILILCTFPYHICSSLHLFVLHLFLVHMYIAYNEAPYGVIVSIS